MRSLGTTVAALALCDSVLATSRIERLPKRQNSKTVALSLFQSDQSAYLANITVGTPPQTVTVQIDTGSSDLWVYSNNVKCDDPQGCIGPYFNPSKSSTYTNVGTGLFNASYGDDSMANGDYMTETVTFGGVTIKNVTMGLAHDAESELPFWGIMGIDFPAGEFLTASTEESLAYYNLPYWMTAEGIINEPVYSLYLDDINAQSSSLLFGGIDTDKFNAPLTILDVESEQLRSGGSILEFYAVPLTAAGAIDSQGHFSSFSSKTFPLSVVLDSGSTDTSLPSDTVQDIYKQLGVINSRDAGPYVECSFASSDIKLAFQFGGNSGALIGVPMSEMVATAEPIDTKGKYCSFGITPGEEGNYIFGDTFLRSAYVVFDPGNAQVGIAQAKLNVTQSNNQALSAMASINTANVGTVAATVVGQGTGYGTGGIPGSTVAASVAQATAAASGARITQVTQARGGSSAVATGVGSVSLGGGTSINGIGQLATMANAAPASSSSKGAAAGLAPPNWSSILGVVGGSVAMMVAGLGGAAVVFAGM